MICCPHWILDNGPRFRSGVVLHVCGIVLDELSMEIFDAWDLDHLCVYGSLILKLLVISKGLFPDDLVRRIKWILYSDNWVELPIYDNVVKGVEDLSKIEKHPTFTNIQCLNWDQEYQSWTKWQKTRTRNQMKKILKAKSYNKLLKKLYKKKTYMKIYLEVSWYQMNLTATTPILI